jgi:hypothetical protein
VLIWGVFNQAVLEPGIWGKPRDLLAIDRIVREELPSVLEYLEGEVPGQGFLFDDVKDRHRGHLARDVVSQPWVRTTACRRGALATHGRVRRSRAGRSVVHATAALRGTPGAHTDRAAARRAGGTRRAAHR